MDESEALEILKLSLPFVASKEVNEAAEKAVEALEKQIPKKPEMEQNRYDDDCWECPSCGSFLGYEIECREESYQMNYCPCCGQKISWEDSEV